MAPNTFVSVGQNVEAHMEGEDLILKVHGKTALGPSASGKMTTIGNTGGFVTLPFEVVPGKPMKLNLYVGFTNK